MLFKDQAAMLVSRWECMLREKDVETIAAQTSVSLAAVENVPEEVFDALDGLMDRSCDKQGRRIYTIVRYLRSLTRELRPEDEKADDSKCDDQSDA